MSADKLMQQTGNKFIVCAFYTDKYLMEVNKLKESLENLNIEHYIKRYESRGYWEANTRIKPEFLRECLQKFQDKAVVYIDADAIVRQPLDLFNEIREDIGVYCSSAADNFTHNHLTSTVFLSNNTGVKKFVDDWIKLQEKMVLGVDQDSFDQAVKANPELTIYKLPQSYAKIFDKGDSTPVIEQFQASRKHVKLQRVLKKTRNAALIVLSSAVLLWFFYKMVH